MSEKTTKQILHSCEETLSTVRHGLEDMKKAPERRLSGLRNLVVFGRAVTNVLQNLRSTEPGFDEWYAPLRREMEQDPLLKYFYNLRTEILKQGSLKVGSHAHIKRFEFPQDLEKFGPPPPNAKGFFIGDQLGGSGWEIDLGDGSVAKYYVDLPREIGHAGLHLPEAPDEHLGRVLLSKDIVHLGELYLKYLEDLFAKAKQVFGG